MGADCIPLAYRKKRVEYYCYFLYGPFFPFCTKNHLKIEMLSPYSYTIPALAPMNLFNSLTQDNNNSEGGVLEAIGQTLMYPFSGKEGSTPLRHSAIYRRSMLFFLLRHAAEVGFKNLKTLR